MIQIEFSIWMASKKYWVHLVKNVNLLAVPRVGEYVKFVSNVGDYFPWKVSQVTYHEKGRIEVWTELLDNIDDRMYSFEDEDEFQEYLNSYLNEGWYSPHGLVQNTQYKG